MTNAIPLSRPDITDAEVRAVVETLKSGRLSLGRRVPEFERLVARLAGRSHGVAVNSGTSALHLILLALGIGPGDEVITPAFSFVASTNCILHAGAKPVFADCEPGSMNIAPSTVEPLINERTRAIMAVDVFGNPVNMPELEQLALKYELPLIEDSCEGLGCSIEGRAVGSFGRAGAFSFYPNKQITTAEGGLIVTDDDHLADLCRSLRNQGRGAMNDSGPGLGSWFHHERVGYNFRMSELHAALGVAQLRRLDEIIEQRQGVASMYTRKLAGHTNLILPTIEPGVNMTWFVYVVRLTSDFSHVERDEIIAGLHRHDVGAAPYFPVIPLLPVFAKGFDHGPGDFPCAESIAQRTIALPFFNSLTEHEIDLVCETLDLMMTRATFARSARGAADV